MEKNSGLRGMTEASQRRVSLNEAKKLYRHGGKVPGKWMGDRQDNVGPVMLNPEEYVLPADTVRAVGEGNLDQLLAQTHAYPKGREQEQEVPGMAGGGPVWARQLQALQSAAQTQATPPVTPPASVTPPAPVTPTPTPTQGAGRPWARQLSALQSTAQTQATPPVTPTAPVTPTPGNPTPRLDFGARGAAGGPTAPAAPTPITGGPTPKLNFGTKGGTVPAGGAPPVQPPTSPTPSSAGGLAGPKPGLIGSALRAIPGMAAVAGGVGGAISSVQDESSGYADQFRAMNAQDDSGYDKFRTTALNLANNIGNAATFGYAGKLGRGLAEVAGGGDFQTGWESESDRDKFYAPKVASPNPAPTPNASAAPQPITTERVAAAQKLAESGQADRTLSGMGVTSLGQPMPTEAARALAIQAGTGELNVSPDERNRIYGSPGEPGGIMNTFRGAAVSKGPSAEQARATERAAEDDVTGRMLKAASIYESMRGGGGGGINYTSDELGINSRFNKLAEQAKDNFRSPAAKGNLQKALLGIEAQRADALEKDSSNLISAVNANANARSAREQGTKAPKGLDEKDYFDMAYKRGQAGVDQERLALERARGERDAAQTETGIKTAKAAALNTNIDRMFANPDVKGGVDTEARNEFADFLASSAPSVKVDGQDVDIRDLPPEQMATALADQRVNFQMKKARDMAAKGNIFGANPAGSTSRMDPAVAVRPSTLSDVWNRGYSIPRYLTPGDKAVETEMGVTVPLKKYVSDASGNRSGDAVQLMLKQLEATGTPRDKALAQLGIK